MVPRYGCHAPLTRRLALPGSAQLRQHGGKTPLARSAGRSPQWQQRQFPVDRLEEPGPDAGPELVQADGAVVVQVACLEETA